MVFKRHVEGDITKVTDAKLCVLSCPLDSMATETKVKLLRTFVGNVDENGCFLILVDLSDFFFFFYGNVKF